MLQDTKKTKKNNKNLKKQNKTNTHKQQPSIFVSRL